MDQLEEFPAREMRDALRETFDESFDLWCRSGEDWQRISLPDETRPTPEDDPDEDIAGTLDGIYDKSAGPLLVPQAGDRRLLVVPLPSHRKTAVVATAMFQGTDEKRLLQLARAFLTELNLRDQIRQLTAENDSLAEQVTTDFEELVLLRMVAQQIDVSLQGNPTTTANDVLSRLLKIIRADCIGLVAAQHQEDDERDALPEVGSEFQWYGNPTIDEPTCRRLVRQFRGDASARPVVRNRFQQSDEGLDYPGIREFILVPMDGGDRVDAWIIAVNRTTGYRYPQEGSRWQLSDLEFGTSEATLLSSAAAILSTHANNVELLREKEQLLINLVRSLVHAIEAKDDYTSGHSERVALFGERLGRALGLGEERCQRIHFAGLLHDIGKIGIPDALLTKPGNLTDSEYAEIQSHPEKARAILRDLPHLTSVLPGIVYHHERFDGQGYPDGLRGEQIPLEGRILAVVDSYDAMTSDRPYRKGMSHAKAMAILKDGTGTQWDPELVDAFDRLTPDVLQIRATYRHLPAVSSAAPIPMAEMAV